VGQEIAGERHAPAPAVLDRRAFDLREYLIPYDSSSSQTGGKTRALG
jgi:hypothetical protein